MAGELDLDRLEQLAIIRPVTDEEIVYVLHSLPALIAAAREAERLRKTLYLISIVNQGCGGTLTYEEQAKSAMEQAAAAIAPKD